MTMQREMANQYATQLEHTDHRSGSRTVA